MYMYYTHNEQFYNCTQLDDFYQNTKCINACIAALKFLHSIQLSCHNLLKSADSNLYCNATMNNNKYNRQQPIFYFVDAVHTACTPQTSGFNGDMYACPILAAEIFWLSDCKLCWWWHFLL